MVYLILFVVSVALGLLFALRTKAIIYEKALLATTWTFLSVYVSCMLTTYIIQDQYQIYPIAIGQAVGAYVVMKCKYLKH